MSLERCLKQIRNNKTIQEIWKANGVGSDLYEISQLSSKHRDDAIVLLTDSFVNDNELFKYYKITREELLADMPLEVDHAIAVKDSLSFAITDTKTKELVGVCLLCDHNDLPDFDEMRSITTKKSGKELKGLANYYEMCKKMDAMRRKVDSEVSYDGSIEYQRGEVIVLNILGRSMKYRNVKASKFYHLLMLLSLLIGKMLNYKRFWGYNEHSITVGGSVTFCCNIKEAYIAHSFLIDNRHMANDIVICYETGWNGLQNIDNNPEKIAQYYQYLTKNAKRKISKL